VGRVRSSLRRGTVVSNRARPSRCVAISSMHMMMRRPAARMLARIRSRIEATAPFPSVSSVRVADALGVRTGMDVAVIDKQAFLPVVQGSAAGEIGHRRSLVRLACGHARPRKLGHC
jgi:hypothetical protein